MNRVTESNYYLERKIKITIKTLQHVLPYLFIIKKCLSSVLVIIRKLVYIFQHGKTFDEIIAEIGKENAGINILEKVMLTDLCVRSCVIMLVFLSRVTNI